MGFYPGDPNDWSKEDDDHLHNFDPKDRKVSFLFFLFARIDLSSVSKEYPSLSTGIDKERGTGRLKLVNRKEISYHQI